MSPKVATSKDVLEPPGPSELEFMALVRTESGVDGPCRALLGCPPTASKPAPWTRLALVAVWSQVDAEIAKVKVHGLSVGSLWLQSLDGASGVHGWRAAGQH